MITCWCTLCAALMVTAVSDELDVTFLRERLCIEIKWHVSIWILKEAFSNILHPTQPSARSHTHTHAYAHTIAHTFAHIFKCLQTNTRNRTCFSTYALWWEVTSSASLFSDASYEKVETINHSSKIYACACKYTHARAHAASISEAIMSC